MDEIERITFTNEKGRVVKHQHTNYFDQELKGHSLVDIVEQLTLASEPTLEELREEALRVQEIIIAKLEKEFGGEWHVPINGAPNRQYVDLYQSGGSNNKRSRREPQEAFKEFLKKALNDVYDLKTAKVRYLLV